MTALLVINCAVLGLLIGSFLNVVIHRVPAGRSVVAPPSASGTSEMRLTAVDLVPVFSWLALQNPPATPSANWLLGVVTEPIQRQVSLQAAATVGGRQVRSTSRLEVNVDRSFAINSWTVDA